MSLFLNLVFTFREFFAVWNHIHETKNNNKVPSEEDYFEMNFAGALLILNLFALACILLG